MLTARKVALRVNGMGVTRPKVRHGEKGSELVVTDSRLGEFVVDDAFALELLELLHPPEIRNNLPNGSGGHSYRALLFSLSVNGPCSCSNL